MKEYSWSNDVSSDENGGNAIVRIVYFGIKGGEKIDVDFDKFYGSTKEEAMEKADLAVKKWISENDK